MLGERKHSERGKKRKQHPKIQDHTTLKYRKGKAKAECKDGKNEEGAQTQEKKMKPVIETKLRNMHTQPFRWWPNPTGGPMTDVPEMNTRKHAEARSSERGPKETKLERQQRVN